MNHTVKLTLDSRLDRHAYLELDSKHRLLPELLLVLIDDFSHGPLAKIVCGMYQTEDIS